MNVEAYKYDRGVIPVEIEQNPKIVLKRFIIWNLRIVSKSLQC
jgi:hypothetical protein